MQVMGIDVEIDWDDLGVGSSGFVPCVDIVKSRDDLEWYARRHGRRIFIQSRIECGRLGLRFWVLPDTISDR